MENHIITPAQTLFLNDVYESIPLSDQLSLLYRAFPEELDVDNLRGKKFRYNPLLDAIFIPDATFEHRPSVETKIIVLMGRFFEEAHRVLSLSPLSLLQQRVAWNAYCTILSLIESKDAADKDKLFIQLGKVNEALAIIQHASEMVHEIYSLYYCCQTLQFLQDPRTGSEDDHFAEAYQALSGNRIDAWEKEIALAYDRKFPGFKDLYEQYSSVTSKLWEAYVEKEGLTEWNKKALQVFTETIDPLPVWALDMRPLAIMGNWDAICNKLHQLLESPSSCPTSKFKRILTIASQAPSKVEAIILIRKAGLSHAVFGQSVSSRSLIRLIPDSFLLREAPGLTELYEVLYDGIVALGDFMLHERRLAALHAEESSSFLHNKISAVLTLRETGRFAIRKDGYVIDPRLLFCESWRQQLKKGEGLTCPCTLFTDGFAEKLHRLSVALWRRTRPFMESSSWREPACKRS